MNATLGIMASLIEKTEAYYSTTLELTKLQLAKPFSATMSVVVLKLLLIVMISVLFNVFSVGAGLWLGELLGKSNYGFIAVAVLYIVTILALHLFFQKWIKRIISNLIIKNL